MAITSDSFVWGATSTTSDSFDVVDFRAAAKARFDEHLRKNYKAAQDAAWHTILYGDHFGDYTKEEPEEPVGQNLQEII